MDIMLITYVALQVMEKMVELGKNKIGVKMS
jgi:hypothetical protein